MLLLKTIALPYLHNNATLDSMLKTRYNIHIVSAARSLYLKLVAYEIECGMFGAIRKYDIHTGLDFYCANRSIVASISNGVVVDIYQFTGKAVGSPWWNNTYAIVISTDNYDIVYGEICKHTFVNLGDTISAGDLIGTVTPVLKTDKGVTPTSMLHMEVYKRGLFRRHVIWHIGEDTPPGLYDPSCLFTGMV